MKDKILLLVLIFMAVCCGLAEKVSDLSDFTGCKVKSFRILNSRGVFTRFTAYCNGVFKHGLIPIKVNGIEEIQTLIDDVKKD